MELDKVCTNARNLALGHGSLSRRHKTVTTAVRARTIEHRGAIIYVDVRKLTTAMPGAPLISVEKSVGIMVLLAWPDLLVV